MCGIFCLLSHNGDQYATLLKEFKLFETAICQRGPNSFQTEFVSSKPSLLFAASVLWLQGSQITVQPIKSSEAVFVYNGDVFGGCDAAIRESVGDTMLFFELLENSNNVAEALSQLQGPYAFVYLKDEKLYFARDPFGRRSLLVGKCGDYLAITSVAKRNSTFEFVEVPCGGCFCIDLETQRWEVLPWLKQNRNFGEKVRELESFLARDIVTENSLSELDRQFLPPSVNQIAMLETVLNQPNVLNFFCQIQIDNVTKLKDILSSSVKKRILTQPKFCQDCFNQNVCNHAITGVLFSGGVDCAILALLAHNFLEATRPIDLINVAFEKDGTFDTPDRLTGLQTLKELQTLCPQRTWNFVQVDVPKKELDSFRQQRISDLIYPLSSVLDDSLGCALWFAARGLTPNYRSPCRTLLVGMGADELFGGYTRHRAAFQKGQWLGLDEALKGDWDNLPHRNLGRDDRVVSDHGRQLRTPYLDEEVVEFVQNLNCWERTFPSKDLPQGIGEKILLRSLAHHLGLEGAATLKKRALQFGSRIANKKEKGHQAAARLQLAP